MRTWLGLARIHWLSTQKRNIMIFIVYVQPIFLLAMYGLANPYDGVSAEQAYWFVVINGAALTCWSIHVFATVSDIHRDRWTGLLDITRASPTSLLTIFVVRALMNTLHAMASLLIFVVGAALWYQPEWTQVMDASVYGLLLAVFLLIAAFSLLFAAVVGMSPLAHHIMNFVEYPVFIFSGIGFTVGLLPTVLQWLAMLFPFGFLTEVVRAEVGISLMAAEQLASGLWLSLCGTVIIAIGGAALIVAMFKRLDERGALL